MIVHPSQTLSAEWGFYPSSLTGDPHVEAVRQELVYDGYPDCVYVLFGPELFTQDPLEGKHIDYGFPMMVQQPLRLRVFARSGPDFTFWGFFTYRLLVQTYGPANQLLEEWTLTERFDFPHYGPSDPMPSSPESIPMVVLLPSSPWRRLRLVAYADGWTWPGGVFPPDVTVNHPAWSELTVSYIETEAADDGGTGRRLLRIRPMVGASV